MYYFNHKRFLFVFLVMVHSVSSFAQDETVVRDTLLFTGDSLSLDTLRNMKGLSTDAVDKQITYNAAGYIKNDLISKKSTLVRTAWVKYGDIEIKADSIEFGMSTNEVFAVGVKDSTGKIVGKPYFKSGSQEFEADTIRYNFRTKKAWIRSIVTTQEEGLLRSQITKLLDDGTSNIYNSTYSTCDADTPHFAIYLMRAKVYPRKKIVSGPAHLVLERIPLPLWLPFGFFPIQTKKAASGILIPKAHYESGRGYAFTDGGYYFAINDYFDLTLKGNIFTNGSWMTTAQSTYSKQYKFSGSFSFSYASNVSGYKGLPNYSKNANYSLGWTYNQNAKARPGSKFSASVNMSSSGFDRNNSYNLNDQITTTRQSSVSYSKSWEGTPFNLSASMNHSQNVRNKTVALNLPRINFNASRIYPLKSKNGGPGKWWQELSFSYSASFDNQISTYDSLLFTKNVWKNMKTGFKHEAPLSFQIRPFKNFTINPSLTYRGVAYTQKIEPRWDADLNKLVKDTLRGYYYGHALNPSIGAGYSIQMFMTYDFRNPQARVQSIRHVIKPSANFSYVPSFSGFSSKMYRQVQIDTLGRTRDFSIYEGGIYGTPSLSKRSGNISFSLNNIVEAKVFERDDTTGKPKKIKIIDNAGITTAYNIFADSLNWSPVNMVVRTTLFDKIGISANSSFSLYGLSTSGRQLGTFYYAQTKKLMRLTSLSMGLDFSLSDLLKGKESETPQPAAAPTARKTDQSLGEAGDGPPEPQQNVEENIYDEYGYQKFDVPWTMNINYSFQYSKPQFKPVINQTLSFNGSLKLTKKMDITYNSGYDFTQKKITMTQIQINRDLHCWVMSFNWIPNGYMKMWEFSIRVKASVLADLKYERRKDYHDNY